MTDINQFASSSDYLTKDDAGHGIVVTIAKFEPKKFDNGDERLLMYVQGFDIKNQDLTGRPMVLNKTNINNLIYTLGTTTMEHMIGKQITLWNDPSVEFQGKHGGLRVHVQPNVPAMQTQAPQTQAPPPNTVQHHNTPPVNQQHGAGVYNPNTPPANQPPTPPVDAYDDDIPY